MSLAKFLGVVILVFLAWYVFTQPHAAGVAGHHLLILLEHAGNSLARFINSLS